MLDEHGFIGHFNYSARSLILWWIEWKNIADRIWSEERGVCLCVCVHACMRVCVCVCVRVSGLTSSVLGPSLIHLQSSLTRGYGPNVGLCSGPGLNAHWRVGQISWKNIIHVSLVVISDKWWKKTKLYKTLRQWNMTLPGFYCLSAIRKRWQYTSAVFVVQIQRSNPPKQMILSFFSCHRLVGDLVWLLHNYKHHRFVSVTRRPCFGGLSQWSSGPVLVAKHVFCFSRVLCFVLPVLFWNTFLLFRFRFVLLLLCLSLQCDNLPHPHVLLLCLIVSASWEYLVSVFHM